VRVCLGPRDAFRGHDPVHEGDVITVDGDWRTLDGKSTLVADRLLSGGREIELSSGYFRANLDTGDRMQGYVRSLHTESRAGPDHVIATIETDGGRMLTVDLGLKRESEVRTGNRITFSGIHSTAGNRKVIVARNVDVIDGGRRVVLSGSSGAKYHEGTVLGTEITSLDGYEEDQFVARVRLSDGTVREVILGSGSELRFMDIDSGDDLTFYATPDRDSPSRMFATEVRLDGRLIFNRREYNP
jgi:hypothetical protein